MSVPAWLQDENQDDDLYQFDGKQPASVTPRGGSSGGGYQPTPPLAPKPGGVPMPSVNSYGNNVHTGSFSSQPNSISSNPHNKTPPAEWLHEAPTPPAMPPQGNGIYGSPGRTKRITTPATASSPTNPMGLSGYSDNKRSPGKKKFDPLVSSDEDEDEDNGVCLTATPPPQQSSIAAKPHQRPGASREGHLQMGSRGSHGEGTTTGDDSGTLDFSDSGSQIPSMKKEKKEKKKKHKNGELIDIDITGGGGGSPIGAPPEALLRRLEKSAKKPKKDKKEKKDVDVKVSKIARPRATRPTITTGAANASGTFMTESSTAGGVGPTPIGVGVGIEDQGNAVDLSIVPELSDEDRAEFKTLIQFSSVEVVAKLRSSKFQHRAMAVSDLTRIILEKMNSKPTTAISMAFAVWKVTINDKIVQVFTTAAESVTTLCKSITDVDEDTLIELHPTIEALGVKLRDSNARIKNAAMAALEALAHVRSVGPIFIVSEVCSSSGSSTTGGGSPAGSPNRPSPPTAGGGGGSQDDLNRTGGGGPTSTLEPWKAILARIEFLAATTQIHGDRLITQCKEIMISQAILGLKCTNSKVRMATIGFTTKLYKVIGAGEMEKRLTEVSPAVVKVLKEALEGSNVLGGVDNAGDARQEEEDMASFDAEGVQLSEDLTTIVGQWTEATQIRSVKCLFCPRWKIRERFIGRLHTLVSNTLAVAEGGPQTAKHYDPSTLLAIKNDTIKVVLAAMCEKALTDSVPNVLQAAQLLTKTTVTLMELVAGKDYFAKFATGLIPPLVKQAGLSSNNEDICEQILIQSFAKHPKVGPRAVYSSLCDASTGVVITKISVKILVPRLELLISLIEVHGFDGAPLTALDEDEVMAYTMKTFEHPHQKVRVAAVGTIIAVYKKAGNVIQPYLSQLKGALLDDLKTKIANIARKERSSTAPIQRLAGIVEPLGDGSLNATTSGGGPETARPSTMDPTLSANRTGEDPSMREKITKWHATQKAESKKSSTIIGGEETLDDVEDDEDSCSSEADDAMDNAPVLNKNITGDRSKGVIRPGAARKTRLVFS